VPLAVANRREAAFLSTQGEKKSREEIAPVAWLLGPMTNVPFSPSSSFSDIVRGTSVRNGS
jgi:hypothetical protein